MGIAPAISSDIELPTLFVRLMAIDELMFDFFRPEVDQFSVTDMVRDLAEFFLAKCRNRKWSVNRHWSSTGWFWEKMCAPKNACEFESLGVGKL